jgi:hypothetical protein
MAREGKVHLPKQFHFKITTETDSTLPANVGHIPLLGIQITVSLSCWDKQMIVSGISDMISINSQTPYSVTSQSFEKHLGFNVGNGERMSKNHSYNNSQVFKNLKFGGRKSVQKHLLLLFYFPSTHQ